MRLITYVGDNNPGIRVFDIFDGKTAVGIRVFAQGGIFYRYTCTDEGFAVAGINNPA